MIEKQEYSNYIYKKSNERYTNKLLIGLISLLLIFGILFLYQFKNELIISEICSHNETIEYDYFGNYTDYVELHNNTVRRIDLSSYYLSDEKEDLFKYRLPNVVLKPNEYYVVYVDDLYAHFKISDYETIYLYNSNTGLIVNKIYVFATNSDESISLDENGDYVLRTPTPGRSNDIETTKEEPKANVLINKPKANRKSGFYDEPFYLQLECEENSTIYYTLDSSDPTINSMVYESPIFIYDKSNDENIYSNIEEISADNYHYGYIPSTKVNKCSNIKAIAIDSNGNTSEILNLSYFIDYKNKSGYTKIKTLSIITDPNNLFDKEKGIYVTGDVYEKYKNFLEINNCGAEKESVFRIPTNYNMEGKNWERDAVILYFDINGECVDEQPIDISIHGNYFRIPNQKSFNIFKKTTQDSPLFSMLGNEEESLLIRNGGDDWNITKISDVLNQSLMTEENIKKQNYEVVQVFLDGEYWGVYLLEERVDKKLISNYYNVETEDILLIKRNNVIGDDQGLYSEFEELTEFISGNEMNDINYQNVKDAMDIDSYIDLICFEILTRRSDGTCNNFANVGIWKTKCKCDKAYYDGKYRFIIYDTESKKSYSDIINEMKNNEMLKSLLNNEEFKSTLMQRFCELANTNFIFERISEFENNLVDTYGNHFVESGKRFIFESYDIDDYLFETDKLLNNFRDINDYVIEEVSKQLFGGAEICSLSLKTNNFEIINKDIKLNGDYCFNYCEGIEVSFTCEELGFGGWLVNGEYYSKSRNIKLLINEDVQISTY